MLNLSQKYNITVKFENLPDSILGIYLEVFDNPYIILNRILHKEMHDFMFYACQFYQDKEQLGKITISDMDKTDFMPFIYAKKMRDKDVC